MAHNGISWHVIMANRSNKKPACLVMIDAAAVGRDGPNCKAKLSLDAATLDLDELLVLGCSICFLFKVNEEEGALVVVLGFFRLSPPSFCDVFDTPDG